MIPEVTLTNIFANKLRAGLREMPVESADPAAFALDCILKDLPWKNLF